MREIGYAIGFVFLMTLLYVGTYCCLLDEHANLTLVKDAGGVYRPVPVFRWIGVSETLTTLFRPAHRVDVYLWPDRWSLMP
jgi:hypothetical protein